MPAISRQLAEKRVSAEEEPSSALEKVFVLLRAHSGNDFSCYKKSTIDRRIERRMSVHQFDSLPRYVRFLQENPQEVELLYKELLIGVTNFFRDPGLFDFLKEKAIPQLLQTRPAGKPLARVESRLLHRRGNLLAGHRAQGVLGGPEASGHSDASRFLPPTSTRTPSTRPAGGHFPRALPRTFPRSGSISRLQQVLWNLLKNAIKFTPLDGTVGIRCRRDGDHLLVEVTDNGIGIEPEALSHFQRLRASGMLHAPAVWRPRLGTGDH